MRTIFVAMLAAVPSASLAADAFPDAVSPPEAVEVREVVIDLGLGAQMQPTFPASQEYEVVPWPIVDLQFLRLPVVGEVVTGRARAITIFPAFNIVGERDDTDTAFLLGTQDVDVAVELGPGIAFRSGPFRAFVEARYGVSGHNAFVGEAGVEVIIDSFDRLTLSVGPRLSAASDDYMETYFGVGPGAAVLPEFDPSGGLKDVGVAAEAVYELTDALRLHGRGEFWTFVGDAADSPITREGDNTQFTLGVGLSYRFGLDLF